MIYDCRETAQRPGTLARSEGDARVKDRQINNCYDGFKITYDFFSKVFGRNSIDGKRGVLIGSVHYKSDPQAEGLNNAFWDGNVNQMVFGDGDHIYFDYFTDSLDVYRPELGHGSVQYSSPLRYYW
jgi:Zn-dependent metalloprotease